jgi:hypothetical protein
MVSFQRNLPPAIKEIIAPTEFLDDEDFQWQMVDSKMTHDYASILLLCSLLMIVVVIL